MSVNAPPIPAGHAAQVLRAGWDAQAAGRLTASWMLHGRPGIGKTMIVQQLADAIGATLHDLRLTTIEPQDLRGLPYYDHDAQRTIWYRPEDLPDDPATPTILFLDELTAASPWLQPTVYGLLQERRVGRHVLPASCMVIAAGNAVGDGAIAHDMGTALSDRLIHLNLTAQADDWIRHYAVPQGLHPAVVAFIQGRPDLLDTTEAALRQGQTIACTPRSWDRVAGLMVAIPDRSLRATMIAGTVGEAVAAEFAPVADDIAAGPQADDLLALPRVKRVGAYPVTLHGLNALIFALVARVDAARVEAVTEAMVDLGESSRLGDAPELALMPLAELRAFGMEMLLARALEAGLAPRVARHPAYASYTEARQAAGLDG